jgi:hypothetical protein
MKIREGNTEPRPIVFAFYKGDKFIGFRQDTMGTIGNTPKIYHYSKDQVSVVVKNIEWNIAERRPALVNCIKSIDPKLGAVLGNSLRQVNSKLTDMIIFEVRILKCPDYEYIDEYAGDSPIKWPIYPHGAIEEWLQYPDSHEVIQVLQFGPQGLITSQ